MSKAALFADNEDKLYELIHTRQIEKPDSPNTFSLIMGYVKQFQQGIDPNNLSVFPSFQLGLSSLELLARRLAPGKRLLEATKLQDPKERILSIALSYLPQLYHEILKGSQPKKGGKPYNPILGEHFLGHFCHSDGSISNITCEQVSHHPPISSCFIENSSANIEIDATVAWKANFNITSMQFSTLGRAIIRLKSLGEEYTLKMPAHLGQFAFLFGTPISYPYGELLLTCEQTGYKVSMRFSSEDSIKGKIYYKNSQVNSFKGSYLQMEIKDKIKKTRRELFKVTQVDDRLVPHTKPVAQQVSNESRRVWHSTTVAIYSNEFDKASMEKYAVEEAQRQLAKKRIAENTTWQPTYFVEIPNSIVDNTQMYSFKKVEKTSSAENVENLCLD